MRCKNCGKENNGDAAFCENCGHPLEDGFIHVSTEPIYPTDGIVPPPTQPNKDRGKLAIAAVLAICLLLISFTLAMVFLLARKARPDDGDSSIESIVDDGEKQKEQLRTLLGEYSTVREWFDARTSHMEQIDLTDAESTKLRDLDSRAGRLGADDYQAQLDFIDTVNQLVQGVNSAHNVKETPEPTSAKASATSDTAVIQCSMNVAKWDLTDYPRSKVFLAVRDKSTKQVVDNLRTSDFTCSWNRFSGSAWELTDAAYDDSTGQYILTLLSDGTDSAEDLMSEREVEIELTANGLSGQCAASLIPANLLISNLLPAYLGAYIEDANSHSFKSMLDYIDTNVDENDHYTLFYQMRKEISGGFVRSLHQELKDYHINYVEVYDAQTLHISTRETYDGQYEMRYSEWKQEGLGIADSIPIFTGPISGDPSVVVSSHVTQNPEYLVRKNENGEWKFHSYTGDLSLNQNWSVYNASVS